MRSLIRPPSEYETSQKPDQDANETLFSCLVWVYPIGTGSADRSAYR